MEFLEILRTLKPYVQLIVWAFKAIRWLCEHRKKKGDKNGKTGRGKECKSNTGN